jgi:GNAT superfamily N-acetyltransferase
VPDLRIIPLPADEMDELQPVWRSQYDHHLALTPHLGDRAQPFERAWQARRRIEAEWQARGEELFVFAAKSEDRYVGYALVRIRSGSDFAASWSVSERLAELVILAVLPDWRGQGVGSALLDAVETRLRELAVEDMVISVVTVSPTGRGAVRHRADTARVARYPHLTTAHRCGIRYPRSSRRQGAGLNIGLVWVGFRDRPQALRRELWRGPGSKTERELWFACLLWGIACSRVRALMVLAL